MALTQEQFSRKMSEYKERAAQGIVGLSDEEMLDIHTSLASIPSDQRETFDAAETGDYSNFENLHPMLRAYLGEVKMRQFILNNADNTERLDITNENIRKALEENIMDAAFHEGIAIYKTKGTAQAGDMADCEKYLSRRMMERTLEPIDSEKMNNLTADLGREKAEEMAQANRAKQVSVAKLLFMSHLGNAELKNSDGSRMEYKGDMSDLFAYGGRTNFILPYGENGQDKMIENALGYNGSIEASGINKRAAATHYVSPRKVDDNGKIVKESKEESVYGIKCFGNQYGMDVAVGGIGNIGPHKKAIVPDGVNGHMYVRIEKGDKNTCGSLLVGFESEAPGTTGRLGHSHGMKATSAKQSVFMGGKGAPGAKTDGRLIDISAIPPDKFNEIMSDFENMYKDTCAKAENGDKQSAERLKEINSMLAGRHMNVNELKNIMGDKHAAAFEKLHTEPAGRYSKHMMSGSLSGNELENWNRSFAESLKAVSIDPSDVSQWDRLKVMENVNGQSRLVPLFEAPRHNDAGEKYLRVSRLINSGKEIYAYAPGAVLPKRLSADKLNSLVASDTTVNLDAGIKEPEKPGFFSNALKTITFGAYKKPFKKYQEKMRSYNLKNEAKNELRSAMSERSMDKDLKNKEQASWKATGGADEKKVDNRGRMLIDNSVKNEILSAHANIRNKQHRPSTEDKQAQSGMKMK